MYTKSSTRSLVLPSKYQAEPKNVANRRNVFHVDLAHLRFLFAHFPHNCKSLTEQYNYIINRRLMGMDINGGELETIERGG